MLLRNYNTRELLYLVSTICSFSFNTGVDFDVHHGNGTEEILSSNPHILFISIHVGSLYPFTGKKKIQRAFNVVNVSLKNGDDSNTFHRAVDTYVIPALENFKPQLILISAGFDGHKDDPTEGMNLVEEDYFIVTEKIKAVADKWCNGKIVSVLEGGYNLNALQQSTENHLLSLITK